MCISKMRMLFGPKVVIFLFLVANGFEFVDSHMDAKGREGRLSTSILEVSVESGVRVKIMHGQDLFLLSNEVKSNRFF